MVIETKRLIITTASQDEMISFIKEQTDEILIKAYREMLQTRENGIDEFYITGADATACVKSTCFNMARAGYTVHVISDCVTSYNLKKMPEMLAYYADKGCEIGTLNDWQNCPSPI